MSVAHGTVFMLLVLILCGVAHAQPGPGPSPGSPGANLEEQNRDYFTDLPVVTHEGSELRFYSDLLKGKRAIISFFYVNCPTAQPSLISLFRLQKTVGEAMGDDVVFVTLSVDPERDGLQEVQEYARRYNPQKGWYFVTGKPEIMDIINRKLGNTLKLPEGHLRQFLIGNLRTGHWMRLMETAPVMALKDGLNTLAESTP
jgi:protein SCO1/2